MAAARTADKAPEQTHTGSEPACVAGRYEVLSALGRGGMGGAYRVRDRTSNQVLALKRLTEPGRQGTLVELFEREFHTLNQLAHPRIVRAFDYSFDVSPDGDHAYYTMELLDGGDLRKLAPLPWQEVCSIAYDVCSALSLLHSRRLVHRDLTPRNVRRTADGAAKLIDFGLLGPFGPSNIIAGTPPYVAPELMNKVSLDGRSDLFSLGATLYFALTGRVAFPVARFEQLRDAWRGIPVSPRKLLPEIPESLDQLVMSLLRIDAGSRPRSAAEIMDRVAPLMKHPPDESLVVAGAYLTAPQQVGRDDMLMRMRKQVVRSVRGRGGGFIVVGDPGTGRSRALDTFVLEAKLMGAATGRAGATDGASGPMGVARALVAQIHQAAGTTSTAVADESASIRSLLFGDATGPDRPLLDVARPELDRAETQQTLRAWLLGIASKRLVALAVDDFEFVDEPSAALLAALSLDAQRHRLVCGVSARPDTLQRAPTALAVLREHTRQIELLPLTQTQVRELLSGVFGDVPHLEALSIQLHQLSRGRPRECMALAQHLVDTGVITYRAGAFQLPAEIDPSLLPTDFNAAAQAQLASLPEHAAALGRLLSLAVTGRLTRVQLLAAAALPAAQVDAGVEQLRRLQAIAGGPDGYRMCHPAMASLLRSSADEVALRSLHDQLATAYQAAETGLLVISYHALRGADPEAALDRLFAHADNDDAGGLRAGGYEEIGADAAAETWERALEVAETLDRPTCQLMRLWTSAAGAAASGAHARFYDLVAVPWLEELKRASGYHDWQNRSEESDPPTRSMQAFLAANQRYEDTPEHERVASPAEAIKGMVAYVVFSIAIGARTMRPELHATLPALLLPFAPIVPVVEAMRLNAEATFCAYLGLREEARERMIALIDVIDGLEGERSYLMEKVRAAVCQAIAAREAVLGIVREDPDHWLRSDEPNQRVGAEYIRKIVALHRGDWTAAEEHRRKAEIIALQHDTAPMFSTLTEELETHALARDLTGLRRVRARVRASIAVNPRWRLTAELADAYHHHMRGEPEAAMEVITRLRAESERAKYPYGLLPLLEVLAVEILLESGDTQEALALGSQALRRSQATGQRSFARLLALPVALAEARLGQYEAARARIASVIQAQEALSIAGLLMGRAFEYQARCALAQNDREAFLAASAEAAMHYRPGHSHVLGALHERLMEDARRAGLIDDTPAAATPEPPDRISELASQVSATFMQCQDSGERAVAALEILREAASTNTAYLFLLAEGGLVLAAAIGETPADTSEMRTFARSQIDMERDNDIVTMTASHEDIEMEEPPTEVCDGNGYDLRPEVLIANHDGELLLAGIALLASPESDQPLGPVADAVAKHLIESGDCEPVVAA